MEDRNGNVWLKPTLFFVFVLSIIWSGIQLVWEEKPTPWSSLEVHTDSDLTKEQIRVEAGIAPNATFSRDGLQVLKRDLEKLSGILHVTIEKQRHLQITTFKPAARLKLQDDSISLLIDANGHIKASPSKAVDEPPLPLLIAKGSLHSSSLSVSDSPSLITALQLLELWSHPTQQIDEIQHRNDFSFEVHFQSGTQAIFGVRDLSRQIEDLKLIFQRSNSSNRKIATVNLLMKRNIPITFVPDRSTFLKIENAVETVKQQKAP